MKLNTLTTVASPMPLRMLEEDQLKELQSALNLLTYPAGPVDGLIGPRTRNAWAEFKIDNDQGNPGLIGAESILLLQTELSKLATERNYDLSSKEATIQAIREECHAQGLTMAEQKAYVLATTEWETAQTFKPVKEAFWLDEDWRRRNLRYHPYFGRGYVQITWKTNYEKYGRLLGIDLVNEPDLALDPQNSLFILVHGFKTGTFTGRKIEDYINRSKVDFVNARRVINGRDKAYEIAALADKYM